MNMKDRKNIPQVFEDSMREAYDNFIPVYTTIEITLGCNFRCKHCYNFDRTVSNKSDLPLMSTELILKTINDVAKQGALFITLTGGEVLLHNDLEKFIKEIINNNSVCRLKTNAFALNKKIISNFENWGVSTIDITMYGASNETYKKFCDVNDGFTQLEKAINYFKNTKIKIFLNIFIHKYSYDEFEQMISFAKYHDVEFYVATEITERYDGSKGAKDYELTLSERETLMKGNYKDYFLSKCSGTPQFQCACARNVCGINSQGDVMPCIGAPVKSGNLFNDSFENIWNNSKELNEIRNIKRSDFKSCVTCDVNEYCSRSSGGIYSNTGDYYGCDTTTYENAKLSKKLMS